MDTLPEGFEAVSALPRGVATEALDRSFRTTHDAIRFTDALARRLGDRGYECPWTKQNGSRRLYARDPARAGWIVATALLELSLDVPEPPDFTRKLRLPDGSLVDMPGSDRPRPQPEGPDQRSCQLRLIDGERVAQWTFDGGGRLGERMRGTGDLGVDGLPIALDRRLLVPSQQRPHPVLLRADLDPDGHAPADLAERVAACDLAASCRIRVRLPADIPGGPALASRRVVWQLRRDSLAGTWSYPAAGWIVADGYLGDVRASGATLESAFAEWKRAVDLYNPQPRDTRQTPEELERIRREIDAGDDGWDDDDGDEPKVEAEPGKQKMGMRMRIVIEPPRQMPWPPHRPESVPAVAIRLPEPPVIPAAWRAQGFERVVRLIDEEGTFEHGFLAPAGWPGFLFVGERAAAHLDPAKLRDELVAVDREADRADREMWGDQASRWRRKYRWTTSHFTVLAPGGRGPGPLKRTGAGYNPEPDHSGFEPPQTWSVVWCRPLP